MQVSPELDDDRSPGATGRGWRAFAARKAARAKSSPISLPIFPRNSPNGGSLWLLPQVADAAPPREVELVAHWPHKGGIVLHFAGIDSISAAETLIGMFVAIPLSERAPLAEDEAYIGDLIGCTLIDVATGQPTPIGEIEDVDTTAGPAPLLVVRGKAGEILVPFAKSYLRNLDIAARRVEMALPEGLVDLNAAG